MNKILMFYLGSEWVLIQISIMHAVFMVNYMRAAFVQVHMRTECMYVKSV